MGQASKFRIAREFLNISQEHAARNCKTTQTIISQLENEGLEKKQVSMEYLRFLSRQGIDLNSLFDQELDDEQYEILLRKKFRSADKNSSSMARKVAVLEDMVVNLQKNITLLQQREGGRINESTQSQNEDS